MLRIKVLIADRVRHDAEPAGRALSVKEVRYLLPGPDREKSEGTRDYALMLVMLRTTASG